MEKTLDIVFGGVQIAIGIAGVIVLAVNGVHGAPYCLAGAFAGNGAVIIYRALKNKR